MKVSEWFEKSDLKILALFNIPSYLVLKMVDILTPFYKAFFEMAWITGLLTRPCCFLH